MSEINLKVNLKDLENLKKELEKNLEVQVGIFAENDKRPDGKSNATIGLDHEYGIDVPQRSWLRQPIYSRENLLQEVLADEIRTNAKKFKLEKVLKKLGEEAEHIIEGAFETGGYGAWTPLSPLTIAKKGNDEILKDKEFLKNSIKSKVVKI